MEMGLLWSFLVLWLLIAAGIVALELLMSAKNSKVLLVFVQNNEANVEALLRSICRKVNCSNSEIHLLVIDNCSTDQTVPIINRLRRYCPQIDVVSRGHPGSLTTGQLKSLLGNELRVLDLRDIPPGNVINPLCL